MSDLLQPQNILLIKDYEFEDGGEPKDKLAIILKVNDQEAVIIQALTTSQDKYVPDDRIVHGCTNDAPSCLSYYCFIKGVVVGITPSNTDFAFNKNTFILFQSNLLEVPTTNYLTYALAGRVNKIGALSKQEYDALIACLLNSNFVKRKIKNHFR